MTDFMKDLFYWVLVVRTFELLKKCESCYIDLDRSIRKGKTFTGRTWTEILQHPKPRNGMWNWGEEPSPAPGSVSTPLTDSGVGYLPFPRLYLSMWCVDSIYINVFRCCFPSHMFFFFISCFHILSKDTKHDECFIIESVWTWRDQYAERVLTYLSVCEGFMLRQFWRQSCDDGCVDYISQRMLFKM